MRKITIDMKMLCFPIPRYYLLECAVFNTMSNHILPREHYQPPSAANPQHFLISLSPLTFNFSELFCLILLLSFCYCFLPKIKFGLYNTCNHQIQSHCMNKYLTESHIKIAKYCTVVQYMIRN